MGEAETGGEHLANQAIGIPQRRYCHYPWIDTEASIQWTKRKMHLRNRPYFRKVSGRNWGNRLENQTSKYDQRKKI